jgi:hypothetical protein
MRWMFVGLLVLLVALILSIAWMNNSSSWQVREMRPDGQVGPANDQTLIPAPAPQPSQ